MPDSPRERPSTDSAVPIYDVVADYLGLMDDSAVAILPHALRIVDELGVPAALADGPCSLECLAGVASADPDRLRRLLRALTSVGFFSEDDDGINLTALGRRLLPSHPAGVAESLHNLESFRAWHEGAAAVRSGRASFDDVYGADFFEHKDVEVAANRAFQQRMHERAERLYPRMAEAVDWRRSTTVMDLGGGGGHVLARVLERAPHVSGVVLDRPAVIAVTEQRRGDLPARVSLVAGNFFDAVPPGADTHLLCSVLHDWTDDQVVEILRASSRGLPPAGRVLIVEMLVPDDDGSHPSKWSDLGMMILTGGRERTLAEFARLLDRAGFGVPSVHVVPDSAFSVLEATPPA